MTTKRVFYLDFIRAISIFLIIINHYNYSVLELGIGDTVFFGQHSWFVLNQSFQGVLGVSLFIILSGASLMLSTKETFELTTFFRKRFFTIYPLFWLTYACAFLTFIIMYRKLPADAHPWTFMLTIIGLDGFLLFKVPNFYLIGEWFLGFIILIYMVFPLLRHIFLRYQLFTILLCILITILVTKYYHGDVLRFPLARLLEFLAGMGFIYLFVPSRKLWNLLLACTACMVLYMTNVLNMPQLFSLALIGICVFTILACIADLVDNPIFVRGVTFISHYSYGAFLIHHFLFYQTLIFFAGQHLTYSENYALFSLFATAIYFLSYLLTNVVSFGMKKASVKQ